MRHFYDLFPEVAQKELLSIMVKQESIPDGIYSFLEYYCDNVDCCCTTVAFEVVFSDIHEPNKGKPIAFINYAWDKPISQTNPSIHKEQSKFNKNSQDDMSQAAMTALRHALKKEKLYAQKLNNHLEMVKGYARLEMQQLENGSTSISPSYPSKLGRNALCHCGSGKKYKKCCIKK